MLRVLRGYFDHQRRVHFEVGVAEPLCTITAFLPAAKWTCLLQRIVLQDALNEVMKVYPLMKPKAFVDEIRAFMKYEMKSCEALQKRF